MDRELKLETFLEPAGDTQKPDLSKLEPRILKENPIDMMRAGAPLLPPYLPVVDEYNRFIVEDSPCNFSLMSGLSAITIESNSANQSSNPG